MSDYERIAAAIDYIVANAETRPSLADVAASMHLSPFHCQRLFSRWAGLSPKRFLQAVTIERARQLLERGRASLLDTVEQLGLSSSSRLNDHFVALEAMTPDECRRRGRGVTIRCGEAPSPFGQVFVAATDRGVCGVSFLDVAVPEPPRTRLGRDWPEATLVVDRSGARRLAERIFSLERPAVKPISLAVRGTNFQIAVWRALLEVPPGAFVAYGDLARAIGRPRAARAVGAAVGANPCAFLIPCHRVIRETGELGGYRWGRTRKRAVHAWEAARAEGMLPDR